MSRAVALRQRNLAFLTRPCLWKCWPFLPLVRRRDGQEELGVLCDLMGALKLYGMRLAYDEVMASGIKRQHEPPRILGELLKA